MKHTLILPGMFTNCPAEWKNFVRGMQQKHGHDSWHNGDGGNILKRELIELGATYEYFTDDINSANAGNVTFSQESDYMMFLLRWA